MGGGAAGVFVMCARRARVCGCESVCVRARCACLACVCPCPLPTHPPTTPSLPPPHPCARACAGGGMGVHDPMHPEVRSLREKLEEESVALATRDV